MKSPEAITPERFARAQDAELSNWRTRATEGHIRHELHEHSGVAEPLLRVIGDSRFERGLEVGIGSYGLGFLAVHLADRVRAVDGLDPLPRMDLSISDPELRQAVDAIRNRVRYVQAAAESMPLPDAAYDIVSCINVVDHARDPAAILREMARVLKPGGVFVFGVSTLSRAGELKWKISRALRPSTWIFVAHPHTFQWQAADALVRTIPGEVLWQDRPDVLRRCVGHGRMSFWIGRRNGTCCANN